MRTLSPSSEVARFGPYEVNVHSGEVRKFGTRVKLGEQPLRILILLMERPGELVTREELRTRLWSDDTFVDFDHGLNSAVQRLREGLSDTAQKEQWIETVPRRGYRFVGTVEWTRGNGSAPPSETNTASSPEIAVERPETVAATLSAPEPSLLYRWRFAWIALAVALVAAVLVKTGAGGKRATLSTIRSLAVLPLENLSGDPGQGYFVDGMTDELITALAKNRSLRVISRTSAMQYKGVRRSVRDIARELGVDGILEGSVSRSGERVHMTVQLIHGASDTHVWAESYDRDLSQALTLPSELAQTIARQVQAAVSTPMQRYINPEAHDLYLHGRYIWFSHVSDPSREYFEKAIQLQPDYAAAWSGLSDYYGGRAVGGADPPGRFRDNWEADARKAVELDDSLADAHNSLAAWYFFGAWDWKNSEAESLRAIEVNPNYAESYHVYSYLLIILSRPKEALEIQSRGMEVDPFARPWALGFTYYHLRQFDPAINELRVRAEASPTDVTVHDVLAAAYRRAGRDKEAVEEWQQYYQLVENQEGLAIIRRALQRGDYQSVVEWRYQKDKVAARGKYWSPFWLALKSADAGKREETLRLLEDALREHSPRLVFLQNEPVFDFLHSEPRYQAIVQKLGLPAN